MTHNPFSDEPMRAELAHPQQRRQPDFPVVWLIVVTVSPFVGVTVYHAQAMSEYGALGGLASAFPLIVISVMGAIKLCRWSMS